MNANACGKTCTSKNYRRVIIICVLTRRRCTPVLLFLLFIRHFFSPSKNIHVTVSRVLCVDASAHAPLDLIRWNVDAAFQATADALSGIDR